MVKEKQKLAQVTDSRTTQNILQRSNTLNYVQSAAKQQAREILILTATVSRVKSK